MMLKLHVAKSTAGSKHHTILCDKDTKYSAFLTKEDAAEAKELFAAKQNIYQVYNGGKSLTLIMVDNSREPFKLKEDTRRAAYNVVKFYNSMKIKEASFENATAHKDLAYAFAEGAMLSNYQFLKYKTKEPKANSFAKLIINDSSMSKSEAEELEIVVAANFLARDLINEPLSFLTAEQLSAEAVKAGKAAGFKVEVFNKKKIESLKMGGLLSVNRGR